MRTIRISLIALAALLAWSSNDALAIGTRAGTNISNVATVAYQDANGNNLNATSNTVTTTVSQVAAVDIAPNNTAGADPGDVVYFAHSITNNGNGDDTFDIAAISAGGWSVQVFADTDNDGTYDLGTDTLLTDTDGDLVIDTGLVTNDGVFNVIVAVTVPAGTADGTSDVTTVTATSSFNTAISDSATDTINVDAPALSVVKSVAPLGDQPPGTVLTYSMVVTNGGGAGANLVVLTDAIPANTSYVPGSITQDAAARTDGTGDDNADYNGTTANAVTVTIGTLGAGASTTITFQVLIN